MRDQLEGVKEILLRESPGVTTFVANPLDREQGTAQLKASRTKQFNATVGVESASSATPDHITLDA